MPQNTRLQTQAAGEYSVPASTASNIGRRDLLVLRYMARTLALTLEAVEDTASSRPSLFYSQKPQSRLQRIAFYNPSVLRTPEPLAFVGFVSRKQQPLSTSTLQDIHDVDSKLVAELIGTPGLLSYSSLQLRTGNWYNLVLFRDAATKQHIKDSATHRYAAYQLAPRYYEWIRLHNGVMPQGLARDILILQKTKFYTFHERASRPTVREQSYENLTLHAPAIHRTIHEKRTVAPLTNATGVLMTRSLC